MQPKPQVRIRHPVAAILRRGKDTGNSAAMIRLFVSSSSARCSGVAPIPPAARAMLVKVRSPLPIAASTARA